MQGNTILLAVATVCTGLVAGVFYGFAVAINPAFLRLPDAAYITAMQAINRAIVNPVFALSFFGAPVLLPLVAWRHRRGPARQFRLLALAAAVYLVGSLGVTVAVHIPLNDELATFPVASAPVAQVAAVRAQFAASWNRWHAVRTGASVMALGLAVAAGLTSPARNASGSKSF